MNVETTVAVHDKTLKHLEKQVDEIALTVKDIPKLILNVEKIAHLCQESSARYEASAKDQGERIGTLEKDMQVLSVKVEFLKRLAWGVVGMVGFSVAAFVFHQLTGLSL